MTALRPFFVLSEVHDLYSTIMRIPRLVNSNLNETVQNYDKFEVQWYGMPYFVHYAYVSSNFR